MSARPVTYYEVTCDEPDCGKSTGDLGGDYSAWREKGAALDEWIESDGVVMEHGLTFCYEHRGNRICDECGNHRETTEVDGERLYEQCVAVTA